MKVFISWSGDRSQSLAQALREWLPMVLYYADPWLSNSDIEAGERWATQVAKELEETKFGLICITRENISSPWILFEAGALAKSMQEGRVVPLLLDIEFKDITGPLAQFQAKKFDKSGLSDVVKAINQYSEVKLPDSRLTPLFETLWPALETKVADIPKNPAAAKYNRPQSEVLEELVTSIRGLDLRFRETVDLGPRLRRRRPGFHPMMMEEMLHRSELGRRDPTRFLFLGSLFRDDFPWLYELGVDAYRTGIADDPVKYKQSKRRFLNACDILKRGRFIEMANDKEASYILSEIIETVNFEGFDEGHVEIEMKERRPASSKKPEKE